MQPRSIILGALGVLVTLAFFKLVLDAQGSSEAKVDQSELDKALGSYRKNEARKPEPVATPNITIPKHKPRSKVAATEAVEERQPYVAPAPAPEAVFTDKIDIKSQMNEANRLYDKADYEGARDAALELLGRSPDNVRMKRIVVSSSCIMGEEEMAVRHFEDLPPRDQRQMARRCKRYGIEFGEP